MYKEGFQKPKSYQEDLERVYRGIISYHEVSGASRVAKRYKEYQEVFRDIMSITIVSSNM